MRRALTPKTKLESLRKEAKRWLKSLRSGDSGAADRLKAASPRAPAAPGLRDIQHALALEFGYADWTTLKAALAELTRPRESDAERIDMLLRHGWDGRIKAAQRILARHPALAANSIFTAATCGLTEDVEHRLATEPDAATRTGGAMNWTALAYVTYGRLDSAHAVTIARRLLAAGADPNFRFDDGWECPFTVLTGAIGRGEGAKPTHAQAAELVALLIEAGADPYDLQALYNVSLVGDDLVWYDRLWRACANQDALEKWRGTGKGRLGHHVGKTTLDYLLCNAVGQNHLKRAAWLLERGADAGTTHWQTGSSLHALAQLSGYRELAALLESHGARPARLTGLDALIAAAMAHDEPLVRALFAKTPELIASPLPLLTAAAHADAAATELLLTLGADPRGVDGDGISPLHRAVQHGSWAVAERLIAAGAEIDLREKKWKGTPLGWALALKQPHMADRLAPLSRDTRALTAMGDAARLEAVLAARPELANHRLETEDAPTPLFCLPDDDDRTAAVVETLIRHGADPRVRNAHGHNPAEAARRRGLYDAADLIEEAAHDHQFQM